MRIAARSRSGSAPLLIDDGDWGRGADRGGGGTRPPSAVQRSAHERYPNAHHAMQSLGAVVGVGASREGDLVDDGHGAQAPLIERQQICLN